MSKIQSWYKELSFEEKSKYENLLNFLVSFKNDDWYEGPYEWAEGDISYVEYELIPKHIRCETEFYYLLMGLKLRCDEHPIRFMDEKAQSDPILVKMMIDRKDWWPESYRYVKREAKRDKYIIEKSLEREEDIECHGCDPYIWQRPLVLQSLMEQDGWNGEEFPVWKNCWYPSVVGYVPEDLLTKQMILDCAGTHPWTLVFLPFKWKNDIFFVHEFVFGQCKYTTSVCSTILYHCYPSFKKEFDKLDGKGYNEDDTICEKAEEYKKLLDKMQSYIDEHKDEIELELPEIKKEFVRKNAIYDRDILRCLVHLYPEFANLVPKEYLFSLQCSAKSAYSSLVI